MIGYFKLGSAADCWNEKVLRPFLLLKELCHDIYQNSNSEGCRHIEWNIRITAQNIKKTQQ